MHCSTCSKGMLVEIRMQIAGSDVMFRRCGRCDTQTWETIEGPMALGDVLDLARVK